VLSGIAKRTDLPNDSARPQKFVHAPRRISADRCDDVLVALADFGVGLSHDRHGGALIHAEHE
jgi:hypothetical protein